jgi:hypothetical protein
VTKDTKMTPAGRWIVALALLAAGLVFLALYLRPARRTPSSTQVDEPTVADVTPGRSYPLNAAGAEVAADAPSTLPASADVPVATADGAGPTLCGGKACKEDQFCCGPPACGHCANKLMGPECPTKCP